MAFNVLIFKLLYIYFCFVCLTVIIACFIILQPAINELRTPSLLSCFVCPFVSVCVYFLFERKGLNFIWSISRFYLLYVFISIVLCALVLKWVYFYLNHFNVFIILLSLFFWLPWMSHEFLFTCLCIFIGFSFHSENLS